MVPRYGKTLFSDHYLRSRLPEMPEWQEDAQPVLEAIRPLWQKASQQGDAWNEAQTEQEFVQPVLKLLGWHYIVQPKSLRSGRISRPDYALFAHPRTCREAYQHQGEDELFYQRAVAIAEAKYWGRPLSLKDASQRDAWKADANPSFQMVSYLVGTGAAWGILTNGMQWRLYSREVSSTASEFYEVDLGGVFDCLPPASPPNPEQLDQFRRWWLFFRREAFLPDAQGKCFVQRVHEGSAAYARQISEKLKELVFEEVMPEIAGGFVAYRRREKGVQEETEETLRQIYQGSLSLLYKVLFLLYAEARGLLPIQNPGYWEQSLTALAQWAAERLDGHYPISDAFHAASRYASLLALFRRIDQGDPSLGIPRYNGGLFNPAHPENQFLEEHRLSDRVVARVVDMLARDQGQPVDYAYISVRNLGAIYEGLLEYKLQVVDADRGRVELVADKGERKATGSYYTPDYIVRYIVEHTLRPILDEREHLFRQAMDRYGQLRRKRERANRPKAIPLLDQELEQAEDEVREAFLGIKVLDPAMGSGHFLVNAVDYLADGVIRRMQAYHDGHPETPWEWNPIQRLIEQLRSAILQEMSRQGVEVDPSRLDDTALLTRLVMKRCIYGVDLNPLAVELAKLSLWLHSFTVGAPLGFLDHHLRCGNSLLGVDVRTVQRAMKLAEGNQLALFAGPFVGLLDLTSLMLQVVEKSDATLADVQESAQIYDQFQRHLLPYKQVLDLWMSRYFGNGGIEEFLRTSGQEVLAILRGQQPPSEREQEMLAQARRVAQEKRFFHWDLEFPEVFIDLRRRDWAERPGFHAVIGNPPYGADVNRSEEKFIRENVCPLSTGHDTAEYFLERADGIIRSEGMIGMIVPKSIAFYSQWAGFRTHLIQQRTLWHLLDAGIGFEGVNYEQLVIVFQKRPADVNSIVVLDIAEPLRRFALAKSIQHLGEVKQELMNQEGVLIFRPIPDLEEKSIRKILARSWPLSSLAQNVFRGLYIPDKTKEGLKRGSYLFINKVPDVGRYEIRRVHKIHLDAPRHRQKAAAVKRPRLFFKVLRGRRIVAYPDSDGVFLTTEKLVNMVLRPDVGYRLPMLAAVINSPVPSFYLQKMLFSETTETSRVMDKEYSGPIPIPRMAFVTPAQERERLTAEGKKLLNDWIAGQADHIGPEGRCGYRTEAFLADPVGRWIAERLATVHTPDPELVRRHNADPLHHHWQLSETGPAEQSDVVHDLLASLAEQMIQMNQQKQEEMRGFLAWLEGQVGAKLEELTGKSRMGSYLGDYQRGQPHLSLEGLLDILRQNRRQLKIKPDPDARSFQERLEKEYTASLEKLLPLKRRLAATDRLIDLVVFQLYGLTPEEADLVEEG